MASNYRAWEIKESDFPAGGSIEAKINFVLGYGILAPSTHNTQPWLFKTDGNRLTIGVNPALKLPFADPSGRNLYFSLGCCVENICVAANHFGLSARVTMSKSETIEITFSSGPVDESRLFDGLTARFSNKLAYDGSPLKPRDKESFIASSNPSSLALIEDRGQIQAIAALHREAAARTQAGFLRELAGWLRPNDTAAEDGMPGFVMGAKPIQAKIMQFVLGHFPPIVKIIAKKDEQLILSGSAAGVIVTRGDGATDWLEAGRSYERLALCAASLGMAMTPMAAMIEDVAGRKKLKDVLSISGNVQIFFRLGYNKDKHYHTPRRNPGSLNTANSGSNDSNAA